jgi:hypothetical protein
VNPATEFAEVATENPTAIIELLEGIVAIQRGRREIGWAALH